MPFLSVFIAALVSSLTSQDSRGIPPQNYADNDIDQLVQASRSDDRSEWLPAASRLGELAHMNQVSLEEVWTRARVNSLGMKFVEIEPGTLTMGPDLHRILACAVAHPVRIARGYFIGVTEVTNRQFSMLFPGPLRHSRWSPDADSPAVNVTWDEAVQFCRLLSERDGGTYRLPTEAEWEYACRAGTTTQFCFGDDPGGLAKYGWSNYANGRAGRVALLLPNAWGLYDMHGNAAEWVSDWYSEGYYSQCAAQGVVQDPTGPTEGWTHTLRGGNWVTRDWVCTSTVRCPLPLLDKVPFSKEKVGVSVYRLSL